ncbi:unnamed protein product [Tuber melanosporum]|uniref:(Perigord truffle) hypothetical protein n=1 Tax=Tuber melanosporum (strain Mel28) TaxID=656061 RepID=D5GCC0_TUBMM|nr:uncharacterized protein GSTUM_00005810001 [Tuber melanosporum]CAZ82163.1 unnamed protein product [Tuber melanosporum]
MSAPPSIPPRPSRSTVPSIPPRPSSKPRSKSPLEQEGPALTTIPPTTELHAPVARPPAPKPTESGSGITTSITLKNDSGIPQIGRRVPMYPNAGDVQAPSPAVTPGAGRRSHVYREEWEMDEGAYGHGTPKGINPYTRSSTDLNQSVAQSPDLGDANDASTPVPDEEIGYLASEQYARVISPQLTGTSATGHSPTLRRRDSEDAPVSLYGIVTNSSTSIDEKDKEISIHLDALPHHGGVYHHHHHHDSRAGTRPGSALGMMGEDEEEEEREHPILASDEVQKRGGEFMLPAISPPLPPRRPGSMPNTRPHSVAPTGPGSVADEDEDGDIEPADLPSNTGFELRESLIALQPGEETEPLFPEDEDEDAEECVTGTVDKTKEKLKHPDLPPSVSSGHRFPSKDIWEEAPDHAQLQAIVSSPPIADPETRDGHREEGEPAERARDYRHEVQSEGPDEHLDRLLKRGKKSEESVGSGDRNGVKRFPSNDIWEDVPPSLQLSATVTPSNDPQEENTNEHESRATTTGTTRLEDKIASIPEEEDNTRPTTGAPIEGPSAPKPDFPARPQVPSTPPGNPPPVSSKPKPAIPPRTGGIGGKIAALKAGFMNDLDQRLKLGPQAPKQEENPVGEEDKPMEVLSDVRKSRARGPRGRKLPTAKEAETKTETKADPAAFKMEIVGVWTVWSMNEEGVNVGEESTISSAGESETGTKPEPMAEDKKEEMATTPSATTLPGATGTGRQTVPAVSKDFDTTAAPPSPKAEEKEEKDTIPTTIAGDQHPEDAIGTGEAGDERADEAKQEGVRNTAGDQKVEV